jgi:hypothetical protein
MTRTSYAWAYIPTVLYDQYTDRKGNSHKMPMWRYDQYSDLNVRFLVVQKVGLEGTSQRFR